MLQIDSRTYIFSFASYRNHEKWWHMWDANGHRLCAGSSLQQAGRCGQSIPVNL